MWRPVDGFILYQHIDAIPFSVEKDNDFFYWVLNFTLCESNATSTIK